LTIMAWIWISLLEIGGVGDDYLTALALSRSVTTKKYVTFNIDTDRRKTIILENNVLGVFFWS
jgi:hypothetical protein